MEVTNLLLTTYREWRVTPDETHPDRFNLEKIKTGEVLGSFVLAENGDPAFLNLIASAPELQDIAEMFRDHMQGNPMERTMLFSKVMEVLERTEQPYTMKELAVCAD